MRLIQLASRIGVGLMFLLIAASSSGEVGAAPLQPVIIAEAAADGDVYSDPKTYVDPCANVVTSTATREVPPVGPFQFTSQRIEQVETYEPRDGLTKIEDDVLYVRWWTRCLESTGEEISEVTRRFWVGVPRDIDLVEAAKETVVESVPAPNVTWPTKDPDFLWVYVQTETEWRIDNLDPISATARASNRIATAEATVTATPFLTVMLPGHPNTGFGQCTPDHASLPFDLDVISPCDYVYTNSSAISPTDAFEPTIEVMWNVTTDVAGADPMNDLTTSWSEPLQVGEVQALVISTP